ncbi:MAG: carbohydrate ABC transporter permease [Candidatus Limnocylindria bacterium]
MANAPATAATARRASIGALAATTQPRWRRNRDTVAGWVFLTPFLVFYLVFLIYPVFQGFWISLHHWELVGTDIRWIGFENYRRLLGDETFWSSLAHTGYFVLLTGPVLIFFALVLALLLNRAMRGIGLWRTFLYLPVVFSVSVLTTIWLKLYDPNYGLLAALWSALGLEPIHWLQSYELAMPAVAIASIWWSVGTAMVIFLAGLQDIHPSLYEAARIDGAGRWALFRYITVPGLRRTFTFVVIIQVIGLMQVFGQVFNMTRGGPTGTTRTLVMHIYETAFRDWQLGYGSAMSFVLFGILFVLSLIQLRFFVRSDK